MSNIKATIIILDYLKAPQAVANVKSIFAQKADFDFKIIVIDNSCAVANAKILSELIDYENVKLQINSVNTGYPKAHNAVKGDIEGDYIFIVNPDILWKENDALSSLIGYMEKNPDIGVLGPKQIENSGKIAMTIRAFPKLYLQVARRTFLRHLPLLNKKVKYDEMRHLDYEKTQDVDWLQSSCVVIRKKLWDLTGGLREDYFLFMSDVEICFQSWSRGYRVVYFPQVKVYADGKRVSAGGFIKFFQSRVLRQHVKDSLKYRMRHLFAKNPRIGYYKNRKKRY
jgi:GT2 family glycosyltransferase